MSQFDLKVLWTVSMTTGAAEDQLLAHAKAAGCTGVAIRTSNSRLANAIPRFRAEGIKVFAWRWPARTPVKSPPNYYAVDQAKFVASTLIPAGLNGFYAEIESDGDGKPTDWDSAEYAPVAREFCKIITDAAPADFTFALTAGCGQPTGNPHIPWAEFAPHITFVMPQTYWRWLSPKTGKPGNINGGSPAAALEKAENSWPNVFPGKEFVPIMGELAYVTAAEIADYGERIASKGIKQFHTYTDGNNVPLTNLATIAEL